MRMTNTSGLMVLARLAHGRNRSVHEDQLAMALDPDGCHLLAAQYPHNDAEWRTLWMVKLEGQAAPTEIWLDIPMGEALERFTVPVPVH